MDLEMEKAAIYGRINALEYLFRTFIIQQIGHLSNNIEVAEQYRARVLMENSKNEVSAGDPTDGPDTNAQMLASLNLWFDQLVKHLEAQNSKGSPPQTPDKGGGMPGSGTKH